MRIYAWLRIISLGNDETSNTMKLASYPTNFPPPLDKMVNSDGTMANGLRFLLNALFFRTGGPGGLPEVATGIVAAGTTQADATLLQADWNSVDTVPANSGVRIPPLIPGQEIIVINTDGIAVKVYPSTGVAIDALGANAAFSLTNGKEQTFRAWSATQLRSIKLG
jgi:hypothetical protein